MSICTYESLLTLTASDNYKFSCSGSNDPTRWLIYVGKHHVTKNDPTETTHRVQAIIVHESYDNMTLRNDIALLKLLDPIQFTDYVKPICIPPTRRRVVTVGDVCYSLGWGDTLGKYNKMS